MPTSLSTARLSDIQLRTVPQLTYCGTRLSSICKWLSYAKYENLYINHMRLNVSHINLLFSLLLNRS
jgi:hypothetical protein